MTTYAALTPRWIDWIAENRSLGVSETDIAAILAANGFGPQSALDCATPAPRPEPAPIEPHGLRKQEFLMNIYSELWSQRPGATTIDRASSIVGDEFYRWYYCLNCPVVLNSMMDAWPALHIWTPHYFRELFGSETVEVMMGRTSDSDYEINCEQHKGRMRMDQYVDMVQCAGSTNDFYMVANNRSLQRGGALYPLLSDLRFFDGILDPWNTDGKLFLWFGPAGTVTPLHHDSMNILLAQVLGRKKVILIPSFQTHLVYNHLSVYSRADPDVSDCDRYPLFKNVTRMELELQPGDVLFIPVGWWHHVRSQDISISVSFTNFLFPNKYQWGD
jgi:hypothetical protein